MQKIVCCLLLMACCSAAMAQQSRFIYIQTENKQPFYVKVDKKIFSSSASGYVIIPKLIDGVYNLSIGFPKNESAPQNIQCVIDKKDQGYLLKNFGDKGWGLFNLQTLNILMANNAGQTQPTPTVIKENKTDTFTDMLANAVNDPSIKQTTVIVEPVKQEEPVVEIVKPVQTETPVEPVVEAAKETITRTLYNTTIDGTELVYIDKNGNDVDTIIIFIPAEKNMEIKPAAPPEKIETGTKTISENSIDTIAVATLPVKVAEQEVKYETKTTTDSLGNTTGTVSVINAVAPKNDCKSIATDDDFLKLRKKMAATDSLGNTTGTVSVINAVAPKNDCKSIATDDDFLKLRKKMAATDSDDDMIATAKKIFKTKCFSTAQIKNLGFLFLKDQGKYEFFDAAYLHVTDKQSFKELQDQLSEEYYINRFKVMIQ